MRFDDLHCTAIVILFGRDSVLYDRIKALTVELL